MDSTTLTLTALQEFGTSSSSQVLCIRGWWNRYLVVRERSQLRYFDTTDLAKVCKLAREATESTSPSEKQKIDKGLSRLRTRCLRYCMRHEGVSREMTAFFKTLTMHFAKPKSILERIKGLWPFTLPIYSEAEPQNHLPGIKATQKGKVKESTLPKLSSLQLHPNKLSVFQKILKAQPMTGELEYLKFGTPQDEDILEMSTKLMKTACTTTSHEQGYDYQEVGGWWNPKHFTCHVNFGDNNLFGFWNSPLAAQDELMVMNFPTLGLLADHLKGWFSSSPSTKGTPWLIKGAKHYASVKEGALYGDKLSSKSPEEAADCVSQKYFPSSKNILVLTALHVSPDSPYSFSEILTHFKVAYAGFKGAKQEADASNQPLAICTGNWGTGAFGNDPVKMAVVQILAARFAGVDTLKYFTFDAKGQEAFEKAQRFVAALDALHKQEAITPTLGSLLHMVHQAEFRHGVSNGT